MIAEELIVKIRAEARDAVREINRVERASDKASTSLVGMARSAATFLKGAAIIGLLRGAVRGLVDLSDAAADAEETFAKFNTVFDDIGSDATSALEDLAESFDLADSTAARLLGNTGDLLTGFGLTQDAALELSEATTRLAIDLASFTNAQGGAEAVSRALTSAYAGERESLKTYGIVLTEADVQARVLRNTMEGLTFESERQARAFATLQLAQEQSANAIGDYERTSDSAANVARRLDEGIIELRENFGILADQAITPARRALIEFVDAANEFMDLSIDQRVIDLAIETGDISGLTVSGVERAINRLENAQREIAEGIQQRVVDQANIGVVVEDQMRTFEQLSAQVRQDTMSRIASNPELIAMRNDLAQLEQFLAELRGRESATGDVADDADEEDAAARRAANLQLIAYWYDKTEQAQREALEADLARLRSFEIQGQRTVAAIAFIEQQLAELNEETGRAFGGPDGPIPEMNEDLQAAIRQVNSLNAAFSEAAEANAARRYAEQVSEIQSEMQNVTTAFTAGIGAIDAWSWAFNRALKENIANLESLMESMDERHEREINFAEATGASEKELTDLKKRQADEQKAAEDELEAKKRDLARKQFARQKAMNTANAIMNTAEAVTSALTAGPFIGPILAGIVGALGAAQVAGIASQPMPAFERGGSFVTNGPQAIMVGDGQSPRERVTVEPLSGPYRNASGGNIVVNISGVVGDRESVAQWVHEAIRRGQSRGAIRV